MDKFYGFLIKILAFFVILKLNVISIAVEFYVLFTFFFLFLVFSNLFGGISSKSFFFP